MCVLYCNGERVNSYGDKKERSVAAKPVIAELSEYLRFGESNLIAIQFFDWGASGGIWRPPCALTTDSERLPADSIVACYADYEAREVRVDVDLAGLGIAMNHAPEALREVADETFPDVASALTKIFF